MYRGNTIGVVIPAYNEAGFVGNVITTVPPFIDRVYVVDDCSTDDTWTEIQQHARLVNGRARTDEPLADGGSAFVQRVVPIRHEQNGGVGAAITTGYARARDDGIDVVAVLNGDGQMDPNNLARVADPIVDGVADYVKGNRLVFRDYRRGMSAWRFFGNSVLSFLTKVASGYWKLTDPQNGYTAISGTALEELDLDELYEDYGFLNHLLVHLNARGMRVADVAMPAIYGDETSGIRYSKFIPRLSWLLLRSFVWRLKVKYLVFDFHPLVLCYLLGAVGLVVGSLGGVVSLAAALLGDDTGLLGLGVSALLTLVGGLSVTAGMLLDMDESDDLELLQYDRLPDDGRQVTEARRNSP